MPVTPFMFLDLPTVSVTPGTDWAEAINVALGSEGTGVSGHDHSSGKGVPVPSRGLNIDADLDFQQWSAINLVSSQYVDQTDALSGTNLTYFLSGDLYVIDGSGRSVRITENGAISAASFGGITGLVSPASASFATDMFTWLYDTGKYALMATGPLIIRRTGETSPFPVILTPPASMPSPGYTLTFPSALSASNTYLLVNASGAMSFSTTAVVASVNSAAIDTDAVTTSKIEALAVTRAKLAAVGQQVSSSCADFQTVSSSMTDVTNLTVTLSTTTTRPIVVACQQDGGAFSGSGFSVDSDSVTFSGWEGQIVVSGAETATVGLFTGRTFPRTLTTGDMTWPPSTMTYLYVPSATGSFTFKIQIRKESPGGVPTAYARAKYMKLVAYQL